MQATEQEDQDRVILYVHVDWFKCGLCAQEHGTDFRWGHGRLLLSNNRDKIEEIIGSNCIILEQNLITDKSIWDLGKYHAMLCWTCLDEILPHLIMSDELRYHNVRYRTLTPKPKYGKKPDTIHFWCSDNLSQPLEEFKLESPEPEYQPLQSLEPELYLALPLTDESYDRVEYCVEGVFAFDSQSQSDGSIDFYDN